MSLLSAAHPLHNPNGRRGETALAMSIHAIWKRRTASDHVTPVGAYIDTWTENVCTGPRFSGPWDSVDIVHSSGWRCLRECFREIKSLKLKIEYRFVTLLLALHVHVDN